MARGRGDPRQDARTCCREQDPARGHHRASSTRRPRSSSARRAPSPAFKGYRGFPGSICASPNSMVVHGIPGPYKLSTRRHPLGRRRRHARRLGRRRRPHVPGRPGHAGRRQAARRHARSRCSPPSSSAGPATASATSRTRSRRASRREGFSVVRSLVGHGIGRDMHEDPQIPNFGEPGQGPAARGGHGAGDRADGHRRRATPCGWATTTGRSSPRTARWPPTSSSRSRSRPRARAILTPWHADGQARRQLPAPRRLRAADAWPLC